MTMFFFLFKNSHSELDFKPSAMKVDLTLDIIIPNICLELYLNPFINVGNRAMTKFFLKIATVTLSPGP